jgi:hypothetical protein
MTLTILDPRTGQTVKIQAPDRPVQAQLKPALVLPLRLTAPKAH